MVCLGRSCHFKFLRGCLPQILLGSFLNTLIHMYYLKISILSSLNRVFVMVRILLKPIQLLKKNCSVINKHAPKKIKILQGNQKIYFNESLRKRIMIKSSCSIANFKRERNLVVNLNKQAKVQYFDKLSVDCNSKPFWKAFKPYFSNKSSNI